MVSGRGFMALAALIFGAWRPRGVILACLFFAWVEAMQIRLQGVVLWGTESVPVQFIQILPYLVTLLVLAIRSQSPRSSSRAPRALGLPF
jgi:simple sugar transport system permease protein